MTASSKPRGRRYSREAQQEDRSEGQLRERLAEVGVGWPVNRMGRDLGEDLLVQIYGQGAATGLSFYVQLKSVRDAERRRRKREPAELRYGLEVKDLLHWEVQTVPVVLVLWDVEKRTGYWQTLAKIIETLDAGGRPWRERKTTIVTVPVEQGTDDDGLQRLRWAIADRSLGLVAGWRSPFTLSFPASPEGKESLSILDEALDSGISVVLEGAAAPAVEMPDWFRRIYGNRGEVARVEVTPKPPSHTRPVRIDVWSAGGTAAMPYVDLRMTKPGRKHKIFNNEHQGLPFVFEVSLDEGNNRCTFKLRRNRFGRTVQEAREAAAFRVALTQPGSRIRISDVASGKLLFDAPAGAASQQHAEWARIELEILEKLAFIEPRIEAFGAVSFDRGMTHDDIVTIDMLYRVCRDGKLETTRRFSLEMSDKGRPVSPGPADEFDFRTNGATVTLLGVEIPLGRVRLTFADRQDRERVIAAMQSALAKARATGKPVRASVEKVRIIEEFLDWPRPAERLYDLASAHAGYFTVAEVASVGYASAEQVETEQRVERAGGDVFRLAQFPPSEHEDLVVLWLQTGRRGVFSHDTALALHRLSDILPGRRHITVPPGWEPPPSVRLDRGTVLHHADIDPSEITWVAPIPLTKPLRTLRDCIDKGVSPDLVEQAIDEALDRGMITAAEAQELQLARARSA